MSKVQYSDFKVGQVWGYKARSSLETKTRLLITGLEIISCERIVHVAIIGEGLVGPMHMPFAADAVLESVTDLLNENVDVSIYQEGYLYWKQEYMVGRAGIYKLTIIEALELK